MPSAEHIRAQTSGGVARLLLDQPSKLNALDHGMLLAIERLFAGWEGSDALSVVVIGSTSARAFCVGADLEVLSRMNEATMREWEMLGSRVLDRVQNSRLVSVAAIPGHALGGGLTLAASCDFRMAAEDATFAQPEIELGWIPGWCGVARLARLAGPARAKELCMTGRRIGAAEARSLGLADEVVPGAALEARAGEFAAQLAGRSREALAAIKSLSAALAPPAHPTAHRFDALVNASLLKDPRGQAAIARFLSRKKEA